MMLKSRALEWFHMIQTYDFHILKELDKDFIAAFLKFGQKHDGMLQLYEFKQEFKESMRNYALQFRQLMARCLEDELLFQERLVSLFLEGLLDHEPHAMVYVQHHKIVNECICNTIEMEDNCERTMSNTQASTSIDSSFITTSYAK